jgi:hypothetical protein
MIARMNGVVVLEALEFEPPDAEPATPREATPAFNIPVLTSTRWDALSTPEEVIEKASAVLQILSGCLTLLTVSAPITIGTVFEILPDGRIQSTRDTTATFRVRPAKDDFPTPAQFRRTVDLIDHVNVLGDLLAIYAQEPDWFAVYKMIEGIENHIGGERAMRDCSYLEGLELKRAKQMANSVRHLDNSLHKPPSTPMTIEDARALMRRSIMTLIKELG